MTINLEGKSCLVTGAGSGNGRGIAAGLARAGAQVCAADLNLESAEETAAAIMAEGGRGIACYIDVTNRSSVEEAMATAAKELGQVNVLVNNAGTINRDLLLEVSEEDFDHVMKVNLKGPLFCSIAAVPYMRDAGRGSIINIVSTITDLVAPNFGAYAASKGALRSLTKSMAVEWAPYNIRVNGISPGPTPTNLNRAQMADESNVERWLTRIPLKRLGSPDDYVGPTVLLASDASSWMTGTILWVEGGYSSLG